MNMKKVLRKLWSGSKKALYYGLVFLGILIVVALIGVSMCAEISDDLDDIHDVWGWGDD